MKQVAYVCITKKVVTKKNVIFAAIGRKYLANGSLAPQHRGSVSGSNQSHRDHSCIRLLASLDESESYESMDLAAPGVKEFVIYSDRYELEDPFFREWILGQN